ncbi:AAA family ATPase [Thermosphaera sp.]
MTETPKTQERELLDLAARIRAWQEARALSDTAMLRRFVGLGSTKTYTRVLKGDIAQMDVERQLANYRAVWALIESIGDADERGEDAYDDLSGVAALRRALLEVFQETGNARFVLVEGDTGSGKTMAAKLLMAKYGQRMLFIELAPVFGDSPHHFLGLILAALGHKDLPFNPAERLWSVVEAFTQTRRCLVIDELHHAGPRILNTIKTIINQTPGEVVGLAMPTLWAKLERGAAYEECRQLTGNRLAERVRLAPINRGDLSKFISRRLPGLNGTLPQAVALVEQHARQRGNLAFVRDVCRRAAELYDGETIGIEEFGAAVAAEVESR